jgi:iron complex outermembrane receptor protein
MSRVSASILSSVSFAALAFGAAPAAAAAQSQTPAPLPEQCANIMDDAQRQACAEASEQVDPLANTGEAATVPTEVPASAEGTQADSDVIIVTGSRLRRDERNSPDPVTIIDPTLSEKEGQFQTAEVLQSSPLAAGSTQITSTISTNFVINGGEGVQTISLRGLGANRTLVLLNGRRAGPAGVRGGVSAFDLNVIPTDAIQSIEILKTGASSVYGSDAIAGVVNLITKKDLRGFDFRGFVSAPEEGGGEQYSLSGIYGLGFAEDRGNLMVGVNYYKHNELERGDRDFLGCEEERVRSEATGEFADPIDPRTGEPYCGLFLNNGIQLFSAGASNLFGPLVPTATGGTTRRAITWIQFDPDLGQFLSGPEISGLFFQTNPASLTQFRAPAGFFPAGGHHATALALQNNFDNRVLSDSVIPETERFTVFGEAGFELTDRVDLYFEGLYNNRKTRTDASRQLFFFQYPGCFLNVSMDACPAGFQGDPLNEGFTGFSYLRPVLWAPFDSGTDIDYYRGVGGVRADLDNILPNGFADFHVQHSRSDGDYEREIIFRDAIEFGVAEFRSELCEGTVTAIRGVPCIDIDYTDPRVLRGDLTAEEQAFLFGVDKGNTLYKQTGGELVVGGELFNLPGGPLRAALGAHLRRDEINDVPGEHTLADNLWGSTTSGITAGHQDTTEFFGELDIPLLRDLPFMRELTLSAGARVTSTRAERADGESDSDKGNWTYKLGANWQTTDWLRFRTTYGTSFRSPALFEQFLANESGFLGQGLDPCVQWGLSENQTVRENCASLGIPPDYTGVGSSFEIFSQGGIGLLDPETSRAFTASVIFTPAGWLWSGGRFSLAVDYIDIKVKDQVTQLGGGNILSGCFASEDFPDEPLCDLIVRAPEGATDEFNIRTVNDPFLNIDTQHNKSVDVTARFRQDLGNMGTLSMLGQFTYQIKDKFVLFQGFEDEFNGEVGDPKWVGDLNVTWAKNPLTITYGLQIIDGTNDLEDLEEIGGTALTENNCLATAAAFALRGGPYCPVYKLPTVAYHSLSAEVEATDNFSFLFGVSNLFDTKPPLVSTVGTPISAFGQVPLLGSYYDYYGRRFFVSARAKLGNLF